MNGDGYSDVIVGAQWSGNDLPSEGRAFVYHGSAAGLASTAAWTAEGNAPSANFGYSVGTAGDVNDDGYSDVIVGAPSLQQRPGRRGAGLRLPRFGRGFGNHPRLDGGIEPGGG